MERFGRLYLVVCLLIGAIGFAWAQTNISNPSSVTTINKHAGTQYNVTVAIAAGTPSVLSFTDRTGNALSSSRDGGWIEISNVARWIKGARALTMPADLDGASGWSFTTAREMYVYAVYNSASGVSLCVSDEPNRTTQGAVAATAYGYMLCGGTGATGNVVRMLGKMTATASTNAMTAYSEKGIKNGQLVFPYKWAGSASVAAGGASSAFTVTGLTNTNYCMVQPVSIASGVIAQAAPTANAINVSFNPTPVGTPSITINYLCW